MTFKQFWELAEVYTAPLNLFLILLGAAFAQFQFALRLNMGLLLYVLTIIAFHLAVNIFNNYMDYQNASDAHDYKQTTNIIGRENLSLTLVRNYFWFFMLLSTLLGFALIYLTSWWLMIPGVVGFYIGLFYSYGPRPLNSFPIAETITSIASGFLVPLVAAYVVVYPSGESFSFSVGGKLFLVCLPPVLMMFNNLIANNTCDLAEDIVNKRKTLVFYIGKIWAVELLRVFIIASFLALPGLVVFKLAPWPVLLLLLVFPKTIRGLRPYFALQDKQTTFPLVLKNMSVVMVGYPLLYFVGMVLTNYF